MRTASEVKKIIGEYCSDVKTGKVKTCVYTKLAVKRFERMVKTPPAGYVANWQKLSTLLKIFLFRTSGRNLSLSRGSFLPMQAYTCLQKRTMKIVF